LNPLEKSQWKLLRLRPDNFPHVRIAQFAALIHSSTKLFSKIVANPNLVYLRTLFAYETSTYWKTSYLFGSESKVRTKRLGEQSINGLIINTVVPFLFCYADQKKNDDLKDSALQILEQLESERNAIITGWKDIGLNADNAFDSQSLLQLKKLYCDEKKCLRCRIGHKILTLPKPE